MLVKRHGWAAFALLVFALVAVLVPSGKIVDYGAEGWLWALFVGDAGTDREAAEFLLSLRGDPQSRPLLFRRQ